MRRPLLLPVLALLAAPSALAAEPSPEAARWWGHVQFLASDTLQGRETGSEGYQQAAAYVAEQLKALGVKPGAGDGYLQEVALESRKLVDARSKLALVRGGKEVPLVVGRDAIISPRLGETGTV